MTAIHYYRPDMGGSTVCGRKADQMSVSHSSRPEAVTCARCQKHTDVIRAHTSAIERVEVKARSRSVRTITFDVDAETGAAMAYFCKHATFETFAEHTAGKPETYIVRNGFERLAAALLSAGFTGAKS